MKTTKFFHSMAFLAIAAGFLTGCSKDNIGEPETVSSENDAVLISPGVDASPTNAAEIDGPINSLEGITALPLYFLRADAVLEDGEDSYNLNDATVIPATADLTDTERINVTFNPAQYYNLDGSNTMMLAWYPKADGTDSGRRYYYVSWENLDGTKDLMISNALTGNKDNLAINGWEEHRFTLEHLLAQIEIYAYAENEAAADYWGKVRDISFEGGSVQLPRTVECEISISDEGGSTTLTFEPSFSGTTSYSLQLNEDATLPLTKENAKEIAKPTMIRPIVANATLVVTVTTDKQTAKEIEFTVPVASVDGITTDGFKAGYKYRLNLKFGLSGVILDPDADEWGKPIDVVYDLGTTGGEEAAYPYFVEGENYIVSRDILGGILTVPVHDKWTALPDEYTEAEDETVAAILEVDAADGTSALNHDGAALYCSTKGAGWRLPTNAELKLIGQYQSKLDNGTYGNNFTQLSGYYWSWNEDVTVQIGETSADKKVRCVRDI